MPALQLVLVVLALAVAVVVPKLLPRRGQGAIPFLAVLLATVLVCSAWLSRPPTIVEADVTSRPIEVAADGYVSSSTCRKCHPHEHDTWHDSYHRSMTQRVSKDTVLADWQGVTLGAGGKTWRLERAGDEFWIEMDDPVAAAGSTPPRVKRKVAMSTGSHNMQVYWHETGHGRVLGMLPFTWLIAERRWITRVDSFVQPASDPPEAGLGTWSLVCTKCHVTHARPRLDMDNNGLHGADTHVGEFGIACEACHGPGAAHVAAHSNPAHRYMQRARGERDPTIINPPDLPFDRATMVCGQCHGQFDYQFSVESMNAWFQHGFRYRPGDDVLQDRKLKFAGDEQFWPDGLIRVAGREYNALAHSACHDQGHMTCLSCHVLHQPSDDPRPRIEWANDQLRNEDGDQACLKCHATYAQDVAAHTHHALGSEGSRCVNCHMPHTTYGLMKGVRTHRIASPSVASTQATGRPNACSQCHLDKSLAWTAEHLTRLYGKEQPKVSGDDAAIAAGIVWALKGNAAQRALLAWTLGWKPAQQAAGTDWMVPIAVELLDDPYGAIRIIAGRSLATLPGHTDAHFDSNADAKTRKAFRDAALSQWQQATPGDGTARAAVLLGADGKLDTATFARLLSQRDTRVLRLFE